MAVCAGQIKVYLSAPAYQADGHRGRVERLAGLGRRPGIAEPQRYRDGVERDIDRTERSAHMVRFAGAVGNFAGLASAVCVAARS